MDTKNVIAAISLSAAVIILYSLFFAEPPDPDRIKNKVRKIYQNYGIDIQNLQDEDLSDVYLYYFHNPEKLEEDYDKSERTQKINPDAELI